MLHNKRISRGSNASKKLREANTIVAPATRRLILPRPNVLHSYLDYRQVNQYLEYVSNRYAHFVKLHHLGNSHERREICGIEINWMNCDNVELPTHLRVKSAPQPASVLPPFGTCSAVNGNLARNVIFIEAGTHAREWITVTTALNCVYQLTERHTRNVELLRKLRFLIVPLVNPDGYEYSRTKNRHWRKNRRPHKLTKFVGTDCNRNYDVYWEAGPSKLNRNTYKGEKPFSEPETRAMRNILDKLQPNVLFFLSLHSYGQSIMYPWGYSREPTEYSRELHTLATAGRNAIKSYNGREYRTGSISALTKRTIAGSVVDYVYGKLKVPMALVMELPSADLGFQPPNHLISQIGHESWFGIREMCKRAYDLRGQIKRENEKDMPQPMPATPLTTTAPPLIEKVPNFGHGADGDAPKATPVKVKRRLKKSKRTRTPHESTYTMQTRIASAKMAPGTGDRMSASLKRRAKRATTAPVTTVAKANEAVHELL